MRSRLVAPFALLGAAGGWFTADVFDLHGDSQGAWIRFLLVAVTPIFAALVGRWTAADRRAAVVRFPLLAIAGGGMNGIAIGLLNGSMEAAAVGSALGAVVGGLFIPFLAPAFAAAVQQTARDGSLLAPIEARGTWGAALLGIAMGALMTDGAHRVALSHALIAGVAAVGAIAIAVADAVAWARARRLAARPRVHRSTREAESTLDFGVGDGESEEPSADVGYREAWRVARAYVGDARAAVRAIGVRAAVSSLVAATAAASALLCEARTF